MNTIIKQATEHWHYVSPLLTPPENQDDFNTLIEALDQLLDIVGDNESHPLMGLINQLGDLVSDYENELVRLAKSKKMDGVICGHIHQPANQMIQGIHYLNSGDWVESLTALTEDFEGNWNVYQYNKDHIRSDEK